jgi:Restriction endonuclease
MGKEALVERFQRFRRDYLDTPQGREHHQNEVREQKEVQAIYQNLRARQQGGEDITDEVLKRLLPYADNKGNRERGNRISTWPCITKDIRSWFEGAKWKTPTEWPEVANWLLEISEAGQIQDWKRWDELANQSIRKGFACGFITPIVHCLNPSLPVINSKVATTYKSIAHEFGVDSEISLVLADYPQSQQALLSLVKQLEPLGIHSLLEWDMYCHWNIAKRLGGKDVVPLPASPLKPFEQPKQPQSKEDSIQELCRELKEAQNDTVNPSRFEKAVAGAFHALGFQAEHIGGPGETDVMTRAWLGDESFSLVIDAKTCQPGRTRSDINYAPLKDHQEQHTADYVIVVAQGFAQGNTLKFAENQGVGLLETKLLLELVEEQARSGISLYVLKDMFSKTGLLTPNVQGHLQSRTDMIRAMKAVLEIFESHQRREESVAALSPDSVYWMLKGKGSKFSAQYVHNAVDLLANPLIGILEKKEDGYVLTLPANKAFVRFISIGEVISTISPDILVD